MHRNRGRTWEIYGVRGGQALGADRVKNPGLGGWGAASGRGLGWARSRASISGLHQILISRAAPSIALKDSLAPCPSSNGKSSGVRDALIYCRAARCKPTSANVARDLILAPTAKRLARRQCDAAGNALHVNGDPGRVVREPQHQKPRVVENQQRLCCIVGQLAITTAWNRR